VPARAVAPMRRRVAAAGLFLAVAANCTAAPTTRPAPLVIRTVSSGDVTGRGRHQPGTPHLVGIVLSSLATSGTLSATGEWRLYASGDHLLVRGTGRGTWTVARRGAKVRVSSRDGLAATRDGILVAQPVSPETYLTWNGRPYRGTLELNATSNGLLVVNRLPVEDYVRGVVSQEIGPVGPADSAAAQAQAVAARSYAYVRLNDPDIPAGGRRYDLVATVTDQVYGGVGGETAVGNAAVASTSGIVITYGGRVVNAPYHASCGGTTAEPEDVWRAPAQPYLQRVSDQIPGTDHYYCEGSAEFRWARTFTRAELNAALERNLRQYAVTGSSTGGGQGSETNGDNSPDASGAHAADSHASDSRAIGSVRSVAVDALTPSGRVAWVTVATDRATYRVRGNDIRFVFRLPRGEILKSTYFLIDDEPMRDGQLASLTLRGRGNGHGVGMCQWGAIGRARAGQDFQTILGTYYPGTTLAHVE
jgi:stage II sporulation protein D